MQVHRLIYDTYDMNYHFKMSLIIWKIDISFCIINENVKLLIFLFVKEEHTFQIYMQIIIDKEIYYPNI